MFTQTVTVSENGKQNIIIGRRGTYGTEVIVFDLSYLVETYGNGSAVLMVQRSYDTTAYPAVTEQVDNQLSWVVTDTDTSYKGHGECELFWYVDDALAKSVIYGITVLRDIGETTETPPDPYQTWVDDLTALGAETLENAQAAAQSATDAAAAKVAAETAQGKAETAQTSAETNALKSEGYAVGTQNGTPVSSGSPYYENNAEYMKDAAAQYALAADASEGEAAAWATGSYSGNPSGLPVPSTAPQYHNNAYYYAQQANGSATTASNAKTDAENAQTAAETAQGLAEIAQGKAEDAQEAIENMTVSSTTLSAGSDATVTKTVDEETGIVNLAFGIPEGEQGESGADGADGFSPAVTITDISGGHTVTITDKTHPTGQSFNVMDGQDGASDAGEVTYDPTASYNDGTVGKAVSQLNSAISTKADVIVDSVGPSAIASFPDGADNMPIREITATIVPQQDLHGYDAPWPDGGGRNLCKPYARTNSILTAATDGSIKINGTISSPAWLNNAESGRERTFPLKAGSYKVNGGKSSSLSVYVVYTYDNWTTYGTSGYSEGSAFTFTLTQDAVAYIQVQVLAGTYNETIYPVVCLSTETDTTFSPYGNICPISGWTECEVTGCGKQLFDKSKPLTEGMLLNASGEATENASYSYSAYYTPVKPNTKYSYSGQTCNSGTYNSVCFYDANKNFISRFLPVSGGTPAVFTTPNNCHFIRTNFGNSMNRDMNTIQFEEGDATEYEPYQGNIYQITWQDEAGTVYGGALFVNEDGTGQIVATWRSITLGSLNWTKNGVRFESEYIEGAETKAYVKLNKLTIISDAYNGVPNIKGGDFNSDAPDCSLCFNASNPYRPYIVLKDSRYSDAATFKTAMSGVQLVYELATPLTYTLTAEQVGAVITTLYGDNNFWADTGDISLDYRADTKLYIEKLTAPTEDDMIANTNIASGKFFMVGNNLYLSTASIANGAAIVPGTNCTALSLADALNSL